MYINALNPQGKSKMLTALSQLNWIAVAIASVAHLILGGIWYTVIFRRRYASVMGLDEWPSKAPARFIAGPFLCSLISIITTAILQQCLGIDSQSDALFLGAFVGVGYLGTTTTNIAINPLFPHPYAYAYAILTVPMFLIGSIISSSILVAMR
ncbi:DUF1761 domain-containing protein [Pseudomonas graminis]|uniref:DUF1761 domain-containing protein n=1 Tax=Pseudomonas graminis TaxID=158627 RepID=UPI0023493B46|nr:DUF1761 domain-containing protein [Pseudomonas graminis]MDC6378969.1 DUF1761 domain-containing protein [Pseudomonas graminis]